MCLCRPFDRFKFPHFFFVFFLSHFQTARHHQRCKITSLESGGSKKKSKSFDTKLPKTGTNTRSVFFFLVRFRSIAKSYFRRADGVLLLYDVTCESSFLNVREWVDMIEVTRLTGTQQLISDKPRQPNNCLCLFFFPLHAADV